MLRHVFKGIAALLVTILVTMLAAMPVLAAEIRFQDNTVTIGSGEVVDDDLYAVGNSVIIDGIVNGDVLTACETITVSGKVNGSIIAVASTVNVNGEVTHAVRVAGGNINVSGNVGRDLVAAGGQINIASTAKIGRDLVFGGGTIVINGLIGDDIKGGGGEITMNNGVGGNVELGVESLVIGSMANIKGNLVYVSEKEANIQSGAQIGGTTTHRVPEVKEPVVPKIGIWCKVIAFLMTLIAGIVIILIAPTDIKYS